MNCLVTGGAGFLGSHIVRELLLQGHVVTVLDDLSGGFKENVPKQAQFVYGSILDFDLLNQIFKEHKIEYVFHLAAYAAEGLSHFIRRFNYENNVVGSMNLVNSSVNYNVKCFVYTSSIAVYGSAQLPMTEEIIPRPEDPYGIAKFTVEQDLKAAHEMFGLDYVIFRPHNVYGEYQNLSDKYRNVIGIFINQILSGRPLTVFGDGEQTRAFSYVGDISNIIASAAFDENAYGETFNIGAGKPYSINQLIEALSRVAGIKPEIVHLKERNEVKHAYASHDKAEKFFPGNKTRSLNDGLELMYGWAKNVKPDLVKEFSGIEIAKNLPETW